MKTAQINETDFKLTGRHEMRNGVTYLSFSGSSLEFDFKGTAVTAKIKTDYAEDEALRGYLALFHDGTFVRKIKLDKETADYELFKSDVEKQVQIRLVRLSETNFGKAGIISLSHDGTITRVPDKKLKMEFIIKLLLKEMA